jgi:rhodanese-related sulfurtransferase
MNDLKTHDGTVEAQHRYYDAKLQYEIDPWDLNQAIQAGESIVVVDTRDSKTYARRHVPGSINIPHREMDASRTAHLDRNALYVVYCDGIGCNGSTKGALNMVKLGFRVKELIGGIEWWERDGFAVHGTEAGGAGCEDGKCGCG